MTSTYEIAVVRTDEDGTRHAVVICDEPAHTVPVARASGLPTYGMLWNYFKTTRRKDAPKAFRTAVMDERTREWAAKVIEGGP